MTKKQEKPQVSGDLINVNLNVPPETSKKYGVEQINLQLNAATIQYASRFIDELKLLRHLPNEPDDVTLGDPLAIWIVASNPDLDGADVLRYTEYHYKKFIEEANREAFILAMTMFNDISQKIEPEPYPASDRKSTLADHGGVPSWLAAIPEVPEPERSLSHKYERRLKIVLDLLESGGREDPFFLAQFNRVISNDLVMKMREMGVRVGEQTDEDGFLEDAASQ